MGCNHSKTTNDTKTAQPEGSAHQLPTPTIRHHLLLAPSIHSTSSHLLLVSYVDASQRLPDLICTRTDDLDHPNHTPSQCAFQCPNNPGLLTYLNTCELFFLESKIPHQRPTQHKLQSYRFVYGLGKFENGMIPRAICRPRREQLIGRRTQLQMWSIIIRFHSHILLRL